MGLMEKMRAFLKRKPTQAEIDRLNKQKVDADRGRMEDIRARLQAAAVFPHKQFSEEEEAEIQELFKISISCANNIGAVGFDVTGIDSKMSGIVQILERSVKEGGSFETVKRCFQGLAYGMINGHGLISENALVDDVVKRREDMTGRYMRIAQISFEIDQKKRDLDRKEDQKRQRELERDDVERDLKRMIQTHPKDFYLLQEMTPSERSQLTGDAKIIAGLMQRALDLENNIRQITLLIGQSNQDINTLKSANDTLYAQLQSWESEVDEQSIADILRLSKEFERSLLAEQAKIDQLTDAIDSFDKAIEYTLAGTKAKENAIAIAEEYDQLTAQRIENEAENAAAGQRYEEEQEALRLEAERKAQEHMESQTETHTHRKVLIN